jgi:hypothetical protein
MAFYPPRLPQFTKDGRSILAFLSDPSEEGKRKGPRQWWLSVAAQFILGFAFLLQLIALLIPQAERAWLLWALPAATRAEYGEPREAFTTKAACDRGRLLAVSQQDAQEKQLRDHGTLPPPPTTYLCLPDTVDPRGPKGK